MPHTDPHDMPENCAAREELRWNPGVADCDLMMYLRAARSMAAFAGMCDGGSAEDGYIAASRDDTTINAMDLLHDNVYNTGRALQALVKNPIPAAVEKKWSEDDQKRFVKGLRQYGKNFFKIRKELLSHKETADLVEFYYLWKKSPGAITSRPQRRNRRQGSQRKTKPSPAKQNKPASSQLIIMEPSSGSEEGEESEEEEENKEVSGLCCQNCSSKSSKEWHEVESVGSVCSVCYVHYKKHGSLPSVESKENLSFLFEPVKEEEDPAKHAMKTRGSKERQSPKTVVTDGVVKVERGSPQVATSSSGDKKKKQDSSQKGSKKRPKDEKPTPEDTSEESMKKKIRPNSPSESLCNESSVSNEEVLPPDPMPSSAAASPAPSPFTEPQVPVEQEIPIQQETAPIAPPMETEPPPIAPPAEEFSTPITPEPLLEIKQEPITADEELPPEPLPEIKQERTPDPEDSNVDNSNSQPPPVNTSPTASQDNSNEQEPPHQPPPPTEMVPYQAPAPEEPLYAGPQAIKMEPAASPPPPPLHQQPPPQQQQQQLPPPLPLHPSSSTYSNSISMAMTHSGHSISASSSMSLSYHHPKVPYPPTLMHHHQQSSFNYRPYPPFNPVLKAPPPHRQTPPPTSSPYVTSPPPNGGKVEHSRGQTSMQPSPPVVISSHSSSSHSSSKSPLTSYQDSRSGLSYPQPKIPQPAHQNSMYSHHMDHSPKNHPLPRPHPQAPTPSQHLPPTAYVGGPQHLLPGMVDPPEKFKVPQEPVTIEEEEEVEPFHSFRGPSPEPRVEDVECHRSQSAIFLRHWNRGEFNSCARTDLNFKPVPDTKLARKREERARKQAEKEREDTKARLGSTPDTKPGQPPSEHHLSPFERVGGPRGGEANPALRQLSEYARPHAGFPPPGYARPGQPMLPHGIDPILHYQLSTGMYGAAARESYRLEVEMEREKRERELHDKLKADYEMKARASYDPHWLELQRRYAMQNPGFPPGYDPRQPPQTQQEALERHLLGADPLLRLQMAGLAPELHAHAHAHTHLHLHPHDAAAMGEAGGPRPLHPLLPPSAGYPQPRPRGAELMHPAAGAMLRPPYDEQFAHQLSAQIAQHEHMQRQLLMERERYAHMGGPSMPHPSSLISQHEEFLRQQQQREREIKLRTLEEAARGGRPPMN